MSAAEYDNPKIVDGIYKPRGYDFATAIGTLPEHFPDYLGKLIADTGGPFGPIGLQYIVNSLLKEDRKNALLLRDPLHEGSDEVAPGLVYNYKGGISENGITHEGRALFTSIRNCAAYCSYCTRDSIVGAIPSLYIPQAETRSLADKAVLHEAEIDQVFQFFRDTPWLSEVILSGGDFMLLPPKIFRYIVEGFARLQHEYKIRPETGERVPVVEIVRVGTRAPFQNPGYILGQPWRIDLFNEIHNPNFMVQLNTKYEIETPLAQEVIGLMRSVKYGTIYSQSVLLRGVNLPLTTQRSDNMQFVRQVLKERLIEQSDGSFTTITVDETIDDLRSLQSLRDLLTVLKKNGIIPYYIYDNDQKVMAASLTVPGQHAMYLLGQVWQYLSGLADTARFVYDNGNGKIIAPISAFSFNRTGYRDMRGNWVNLT